MDSSFCEYRDFADIRGVPWKGNVKLQYGDGKRQCSVLSVAVSSEFLEIRPEFLYGNT